LNTVTDEFVGSTFLNNVVFKGIHKLGVLLDTIDIRNMYVYPDGSSWDIRLNNITSIGFIVVIDI
jgi:hypothetical protein